MKAMSPTRILGIAPALVPFLFGLIRAFPDRYRLSVPSSRHRRVGRCGAGLFLPILPLILFFRGQPIPKLTMVRKSAREATRWWALPFGSSSFFWPLLLLRFGRLFCSIRGRGHPNSRRSLFWFPLRGGRGSIPSRRATFLEPASTSSCRVRPDRSDRDRASAACRTSSSR